MKMSKNVLEALQLDAEAQAKAMALPYNELATRLATAMAASGIQAAKAKEEKVTVWGTFKEAITAAIHAEHSVTALRAGLEVACIEAGIAAGSFRGYVTTIANLYGDVLDEKLTVQDVAALSVADARKLYKVEKELTNTEQLHKRIADGTRDWTDEQLAVLCSIVDDMQAPAVEEVEETEQEAIAA